MGAAQRIEDPFLRTMKWCGGERRGSQRLTTLGEVRVGDSRFLPLAGGPARRHAHWATCRLPIGPVTCSGGSYVCGWHLRYFPTSKDQRMAKISCEIGFRSKGKLDFVMMVFSQLLTYKLSTLLRVWVVPLGAHCVLCRFSRAYS